MTNFKQTTYENTSNVISKISDVTFNLGTQQCQFRPKVASSRDGAHDFCSLFTGE